MIVVIVLGVLSAIVLLNLGGVSTESVVTACTTDAKTVSVAVTDFQAEHPGVTPTSQDLLGSDVVYTKPYLKSWPSSRYYSVSITSGAPQVQVALTSLDPGYNWMVSTTAPTTIMNTPENFDGSSAFKWFAGVGSNPAPSSSDQANICAGA